MLQSKAGYIDARPLTASSAKLLQRTAGRLSALCRSDFGCIRPKADLHSEGYRGDTGRPH